MSCVLDASVSLSWLFERATETDPIAATTRRDAVLGVARELSISAYDATYVELAMRLGRPFATFDTRLRKAAEASGLAVL